MELVALRVAAEIVVIVEYQDAGGVAVDFAIEPRGRQAADAAAHHDQVDMLVDRQGGEVEGAALAADLMSDFKGSWMAAPQTGERRWIVEVGRSGGPRRPGRRRLGRGTQLAARGEAGADEECGATQQVATGDGVRHGSSSAGHC